MFWYFDINFNFNFHFSLVSRYLIWYALLQLWLVFFSLETLSSVLVLYNQSSNISLLKSPGKVEKLNWNQGEQIHKFALSSKHSWKKWFCLREPYFWVVFFQIFWSILSHLTGFFSSSNFLPKLSEVLFWGLTSSFLNILELFQIFKNVEPSK